MKSFLLYINSYSRQWSIMLLILLQVIAVPVGYMQDNRVQIKSFPSSSRDSVYVLQLIHKAKSLQTRYLDSSILVLHQALNICLDKNYIDGIGKSLFELGILYEAINKKDTALHLFTSSLFYLSKSKFYNRLAPAVYSNIGYIFYKNGDYTKAMQYFDSSVKEGIKINLPEIRQHLAITLNNIAGILLQLKRHKEAISYLDQAEVISRKGNFQEQLALALGNKGAAYSALGQYTLAEQYYTDAIQIYPNNTPSNVESYLSGIKSGFAELKLKQGKPQEAIQLLKEIEEAPKPLYYKDNNAIMSGHIMGMAYLQLREYKQAKAFLLKVLNESGKLKIKTDLQDIHHSLSILYDSTGNPEKALYHYRMYEQLKDSLLSKEKAKDISEIDAKFRIAEKDRDIAQKQLLITRQESGLVKRNIWIAAISLAALLLAVFFISRNRNNKQKQKSQARQIQILQQQQEINHLKDIVQGEEKERVRIARELHDGIVSQLMGVRLHFTGALQHAGDYLPNKKDFVNTLNHLDEVTKELRKTAHNLMPETVLQGGLVQALRNYCKNMAAASGIPVYFQHFGTDARQGADMELSLYRIIQELLINAIKHAHCTQVLVELNIESNLISITVDDNGKGIPEGTLEKSKGMGMKSIYTRVKALQGSIDISSSPGKGTSVNIELIVKNEKNETVEV